MKIYKVLTSYDPKITGVRDSNQSIQMAGNYPYKDKNSISRVWKDESITDPLIGPILLQKKAKITDVISTIIIPMGFGLVISKRLHSFLDDFSIARTKTFQIPLTYSKDCEELLHDHVLLGLYKYCYDMIDFESSKFCVISHKEKVHIPITFNSKEEFLSKDKEMIENSSSMGNKDWHHVISFKKLVLYNDLKYDLFSLGRFGVVYITEKLKTSIEEAKFTGFRFEEMDDIIIGSNTFQT